MTAPHLNIRKYSFASNQVLRLVYMLSTREMEGERNAAARSRQLGITTLHLPYVSVVVPW